MLGLSQDKEGVRLFAETVQQGFSDFAVAVEDIIVEGDKAVARVRMSGTQTGEFMGIPATDKTTDFQVIDILRFKDGKVAEHWA
jgi:predicted ester cyclase